MKKLLLLVVTSLFATATIAQNGDSVAFANAKRHPLRLKDAEGYTISAKIFGVPQTISIIKFSPKRFTIKPIQPYSVTTVGEVCEEQKADFGINACYWAVSTGVPTTFVKTDGKVMSGTHPAALPRVNGLLFMHKNSIEIVRSYDRPYYPELADKCDNIIACGPVLLDDGKVVDYGYILDSEEIKNKRQRPFFLRRHPRSAIGCNADGEVFLMVVDGRFPDKAEGASIAEMAKLCKWLGMVEAMNLDGGGSSTLWSKAYGVVSHPSDNRTFDHEGSREVSSTLIVKAKKQKKQNR